MKRIKYFNNYNKNGSCSSDQEAKMTPETFLQCTLFVIIEDLFQQMRRNLQENVKHYNEII